MEKTAQLSQQSGVWLLVLSAVVFSTAGIFTKGVMAGAWEVIFWRGIFAGLVAGVVLGLRGKVRAEWRGMGRAGWAVAVIGAISTAMFIAAFKATSVANVALIYAVAPMLTAALAWLVMGEAMARRVGVGAVLALIGVAIIVSGSVGGGNLWGDFLALGMTIGMGIVIVIYRRFPETPAVLPMIGSSVLLLPVCVVFGDPMQVPMDEVAILAAFGGVFALAAVLLAQGAKRVPSGAAALLGTLEAPLAPIWAWAILAEVPPVATFLGGGVVILAIVVAQRRAD